jgi:hypothetical protein
MKARKAAKINGTGRVHDAVIFLSQAQDEIQRQLAAGKHKRGMDRAHLLSMLALDVLRRSQ